MTALEVIRAGVPAPCRPWPRHELTSDAWRGMAAALRDDLSIAFVGLWADTVQVHALFHAGGPVIASAPVEAGLYAALSPARPGAALFERAVADLWGHQAADAVDTRPWLDHGTWPLLRPLSDRPVPNGGGAEVPEMLDAEGQVLGFGPLPPGPLGAAGHWRAAVEGGEMRRLEARLGYAHRGVLGLMRGRAPDQAARMAARIAGAATVAHATAFARAIEAAAEVTLPPRGQSLRTAALAIERAAIGLHDLVATATALGRTLPGAAKARELLLVACEAAFGHRLMMDAVQPGTVADLDEPAIAALDAALDAIPRLHTRTPHGLGVLPIGAALALGCGGAVGRASGRVDPAAPGAPLVTGGDVAARIELRLKRLAADVAVARHALATLPDGPAAAALTDAAGEGIGVADGPQGQVWHWVRLAGGVVAACFPIDPAWLLVPALERAAEGSDMEELPAVAASFGLHLAGMEL